MAKRNTIWVQSAFNQNDVPAIKDAVDRIGPSSYDVVIMASLHVDGNGEFYFGDTPFNKMWEGFPDALQELKSGFHSGPKKLLITIGGAGNHADFEHIAADLKGFLKKFVALAGTYHLDGLDLDFEGPDWDKFRDILVSIINGYYETGINPIITMSPYTDMEFWAGTNGVLAGTRTTTGNKVSWLNVQFYEDDRNIDPKDWPTLFGEWRDAVANGPNGIPADEASAFIDPGCNSLTYSQAQIREAITLTRKKYPDMGGAFAWNYDQIGGLKIGEWSRTMYDALNGVKEPAKSQAG